MLHLLQYSQEFARPFRIVRHSYGTAETTVKSAKDKDAVNVVNNEVYMVYMVRPERFELPT